MLVYFLSSWRYTVIPGSLVLLLDGVYQNERYQLTKEHKIMSPGEITGEQFQSRGKSTPHIPASVQCTLQMALKLEGYITLLM